ncbi:MAG: ferrous iron transport protein B, partial [Chloroflexi bacterium]
PNRPEIHAGHRAVFDAIEQQLTGKTPHPYPPDWVAMKLLEGDTEITDLMRAALGSEWEPVAALLAQHDDAYLAVASGRYEWIGRMVRAAVVRPKLGQVTLTDRIDRLATHPLWGPLLLLAVLGLLFSLVFAVGSPIQVWLETYVVRAADWTRAVLSEQPQWLSGLLANGIITGVGTVLTLLPILILFFAALGLMEDIGYMARAAYVMDRYMHWMGLHGKSFLPLFLGFGCNVPALMGTRIIESPKGRLITLLVAPLMPCTARLSVVVLLAPVFFGPWAGLVILGLVGLSLSMLAVVGMGLHRLLFFQDTQTAFIMELPLYHVPDPRRIGMGVWQRVVDFLKGAGGVILVMSVILWWLSTYPGGNIESSYLATVGHWMTPLGKLMGLDWRMMVALLTSVVRKENTISTLAVLYGPGAGGTGLGDILGHHLSPVAALAFLAVQILFIPCMATVSTLRQETHSWSLTLLSVAFLFVISMGIGILIYQGAALLGWSV